MALRWTFFLVALLMISCEEVIDRNIVAGEQVIVVEAVLTNELKQHVVKIGKSTANPGSPQVPVAGAYVRIVEGSNEVILTEAPLRPGEYLTPPMRAVFGAAYILHIRYQGKDYLAADGSVPVEPLPTIQYRAVNGGFVLTPSASGQDANYIRHEISWKNTAACTGAKCEGLYVFYDLKSIDVNEGTKPAKEDFVFPLGSTIIRRKYSVSPGYRTFLRGLLTETEWRGSPFDVERANLPTNLTNGAAGYFAVTTVVADTTLVTGQ